MHRFIGNLVTGLCLLITGLSVMSPLPANEAFPMQAQEIAPRIYAIITPARDFPNTENQGWNSNSAFFVTPQGVLLFDTGSSTAIGQALRQTIATVTDQPVRWIVNSHAHGDHWLGNAAFTDSVQKIFSTQEVAARIRTDGQNWVRNFKQMTNGLTGDSKIVEPDTFIDERTEVTLGGTRCVFFLSGNSHSPGDLLLWLPDARVLFSGDVVYSDRMPSTNNANLQQWMKQLTALQALKLRVVVPGHGKLTDVEGLAHLHALFTALWQAVEKGYKAGESDFEMVPEVLRSLAPFASAYPGMEAKLRRDIPHIYLQVEAASF